MSALSPPLLSGKTALMVCPHDDKHDVVFNVIDASDGPWTMVQEMHRQTMNALVCLQETLREMGGK